MPFYFFSYKPWFNIKHMINDTDEKPDEEVHKARSGRVPRAFVPVNLGVHHPPSTRMGSPT